MPREGVVATMTVKAGRDEGDMVWARRLAMGLGMTTGRVRMRGR